MSDLVEKALIAWGMEEAQYALIAARENAVYCISAGNTRFALRLHRRGYRTDAEIQSELSWMAAIAQTGVTVPHPLRNLKNEFLSHIDGVQVDLLTWVAGRTLKDHLLDCSGVERTGIFSRLGEDLAKFHLASDAWEKPADFERVHWDREGLLGDKPLWDRFWDHPGLSKDDQVRFKVFRDRAWTRLGEIGSSLDYGLIHADLVPDNILVDGDKLRFIDFDDGGLGFRLFDVATALLKHGEADDYTEIRDALITGYQSQRPLEMGELEFFMGLRAATYVGWVMSRMNEPDGAARSRAFIERLGRLVP